METVANVRFFGKRKDLELERMETAAQTTQAVEKIRHDVQTAAKKSLKSINRANRIIQENHFTLRIHLAAGGKRGR